MFWCLIVFTVVSVAMGDFLPKDPHHSLFPHHEELPSHEWLPVLQREASSEPPAAATIQHLIRQTLETAAREGIKGLELANAAKKVSFGVASILSSKKAKLDMKKIKSDLSAVKSNIMTWGSLNADLVLWDGLTYLLEHVKDPQNIHISLAATKMVSDNIVTEILDPNQTIKYIHVPYQKPGSTN